MSTEASRILTEVLALPADERAQLVERILDSLGTSKFRFDSIEYPIIQA